MKIVKANTIEQQLFTAGCTKAITLLSDFEHEDGSKPENNRRLLEVETYKNSSRGWVTVVRLCWYDDDRKYYSQIALQYSYMQEHPEIKRGTPKLVNAAHLKVLENKEQFFIDMVKKKD